MEGKQAIKFDKYNSQAIKGIAIVMMLFHHMYLSQDRFEGLNVVFTPFSADRIMYLCRTFKICVPIYAFISGYGLYLSYRKNNSTPGKWTAKRLIKTMGGFWIIWGLSVVILQLYNGYAVTRYFGNGNIAKGVSAMVLDFFGLAKLFGTSTLNLVVYERGDHFYHVRAAVYDKGRISGIYSCGCCGISADNFHGGYGNYRYLCIFTGISHGNVCSQV